MRGRTLDVQQTSGGEKEGADTDSAESAQSRRRPLEPAEEAVSRVTSSDTADEQGGIEFVGDILKAVLSQKREQSGFPAPQVFGGSRPAMEYTLRRKAIGGAEDLQRANQVQFIDRRNDDHEDAAHGYAAGRISLRHRL